MKKTLCIVLALLMLATAAGCGMFDPKTAADKVFSKDGIEITLTSAFTDAGTDSFYACYAALGAVVYITREYFTALEEFGNLTVDEYMQVLMEANEQYSPEYTAGSLPFMKHTAYIEDNKKEYTYYTVAYKGGDSFWLVEFACESAVYDTYLPYFGKWAGSVVLADA